MDLPGRLRWLASEIEACDTQDIRTMLVVQEDTQGDVRIACYGVNPSRTETVGLLTRAAHGHMGAPE